MERERETDRHTGSFGYARYIEEGEKIEKDRQIVTLSQKLHLHWHIWFINQTDRQVQRSIDKDTVRRDR